jgi:hypothetical protein
MNLADLSIIKALKFGRVPNKGTVKLAVGRDAEIVEFERVLNYVAAGYAEMRFLRGDYGSGKTFMCSVLRELAFERGFAVSIVNLNREVPFGKRELVLQHIMTGLQRPDGANDLGLGSYLEAWFSRFDISSFPKEPKELVDALHAATANDPSLAKGLRGWLKGYVEGNDVLMEGALAWIRGEVVTQDVRSALKLVGKLTPDAALRRLRSIIGVLGQTGVPGVVVLLDEAESIMRLAAPQRMAAYGALREMVDACEADFPHTLFVFAGTQPLFEDPFRGIAEYAPLYERIRSQQTTSDRDLRQAIVRLEELDQNALLTVATRVRTIHGSAYSWDAVAGVADAAVEDFVHAAAAKFGKIQSKPRAFLKAFVDLLDAVQQGLIHADLASLLDGAVAVETQDATLEDGLVLAGT